MVQGFATRTVFEISTPEMPTWTLTIPFLAVAAIGMVALWRRRQVWAEREVARFAAVTGLSDPGADRLWVTERVQSRLTGPLIGLSLAVLVALPALALQESARASTNPWWIVLLPVGHILGTALGHLHRISSPSTGPRVATLRARVLGDYGTRAEVVAAAACVILPLVSAALAILNLAGGTSAATSALLSLGLAVAGLVLWVVCLWFARRALRQNVGTQGAAGLAWAELLRAQMLRDLVGGAAAAATFGGAFGLFWGVAQTWRDYPDWYVSVAVVVAIVGAVALLVTWLAAVADKRLGWARGHALTASAQARS